MLRVVTAVVLVAYGAWSQDMPATRLAGARGATPVGGQTTAATMPPRLPLPPLPITQLDERETTIDSPRRMTLTFAEPQPIEQVLQLLMMGTSFSLAIDPEVKGSFRGELKQLTLREALTTLLAPLGFDFQVQGTVIRITRRQPETRLFDLNLLNVQRAMQRTTGGPGAAIASTAAAADVFAAVAEGVRALLSDTGRVHVDGRAGLAQVTDVPERLEHVALYIEALQQRSGRQVRLQSQVFEVTLRDAASIDWRAVRARLGLPAEESIAGLAADPRTLRAALAADGEIRDLWAPDVTVLNNEPALLRIATPGSTSLTMTIVPQISADGVVQLNVAHAWQEHDGDRREGLFRSTPLTRVSEADTVMRVMDGSTVLVSGLTRPQQVAAAGGRTIFGTAAHKAGHAELVVLLRPTIVTLGTK
jgi:type II secretory pathway component GspD/PulD (secretin)